MMRTAPVVADGAAYVSANTAGVYALNAETGAQLWRSPKEGSLPVMAAPAVVDGVVYVNAEDGNLYALDSATGELLWEVAPGEWE